MVHAHCFEVIGLRYLYGASNLRADVHRAYRHISYGTVQSHTGWTNGNTTPSRSRRFVYGHLRTPIVLITKEGTLQLIDYDLCGRVGEVR